MEVVVLVELLAKPCKSCFLLEHKDNMQFKKTLLPILRQWRRLIPHTYFSIVKRGDYAEPNDCTLVEITQAHTGNGVTNIWEHPERDMSRFLMSEPLAPYRQHTEGALYEPRLSSQMRKCLEERSWIHQRCCSVYHFMHTSMCILKEPGGLRVHNMGIRPGDCFKLTSVDHTDG